MPECKVKELKDRFDAHLEDYRNASAAFAANQLELQAAYKHNMEAISALTHATSNVVEAWRVAAGLQKFVKWLSSFALVGAAAMWALSKLPSDLFKGG
jgi:hypothetical protein